MAKTNGGNTRHVEFAVHMDLIDASGTEQPQVTAYAYSQGGKLLGSKAFDARGNAKLTVPVVEEGSAVRLMVGPAIEQPDIDELLRRGALEQHVRASPKEPKPSVTLTIDPDIWRCWILRRCFVQGTLSKRTVSGGITMDLPVCHASVDIWEVESWPITVTKLPPWLIDRLRHIVAGPVTPDPGDPVEFVPSTLRLQPALRPMSNSDPVPIDVRRAMRPSSVNPAANDEAVLAAVHAAAQSSELKYIAEVGSDLQWRQALQQRPDLVRPLLCYFYPLFITKQKIATATTDECGHFRTSFFRGCQDTPDLYFSARQRLFGWFDITIYEPLPVACHTYWDYACGTQVTLITTSPFAITCSPCGPVVAGANWVLFTAIGNTSINAIFGGGAAGATSSNLGLLTSGAPWGGMLRPRLDFDNALRETLGVRYYQLSWRKGTTGSFTPITRDVFRHYAHMVGTDLVVEPYRLGPNYMTVGGQQLALFEIPPALPPIGQWTVANAVLDTENGEFDSVAFSPGLAFNPDGSLVGGTSDGSGLYQIKLDLYDAAGNLVNVTAKGIDYYVPDSANLSGTIHTVKASTIVQPGGGTLVQGNSLVLTLHVDNNHCWAGIGAPSTPSGTADPCCGVVHYGPGATVTMPYVAYHPHSFATHGFLVVRSATSIITSSGGVGSFAISRGVHDMMTLDLPAACINQPECTTAAFGERLDVYEMATDGWGSYLGYNDSDNRAFALSGS
jgi:hypothetical protein